MADFGPAEKLRQHRPLLLAMEAVGWLHMAGKARAEFLREHGGQGSRYNYERWHELEKPPFLWDDLLRWVRDRFGSVENAQVGRPGTFTDFLTRHARQDSGMLGLLQAAHGMASSIEKNLPRETSGYLQQDGGPAQGAGPGDRRRLCRFPSQGSDRIAATCRRR